MSISIVTKELVIAKLYALETRAPAIGVETREVTDSVYRSLHNKDPGCHRHKKSHFGPITEWERVNQKVYYVLRKVRGDRIVYSVKRGRTLFWTTDRHHEEVLSAVQACSRLDENKKIVADILMERCGVKRDDLGDYIGEVMGDVEITICGFEKFMNLIK